MTKLPVLDGPGLGPVGGGAPGKLVIFVHGLGADGNDLIGLAPYFQKILPDALFISPNAPYSFDMAPTGYQWFSLNDFGPENRLKGTRSSAPILDAFIDAQLKKYNLSEDKLALIGFSQGTTMSLYVGLRRAKRLAGILGYSGLLVGGESPENEIKSRPPVLLVHGDRDQIIPVQALAEAVDGLAAVGIKAASHVCRGLGHGIDDEGLRLGMEFIAEIFDIAL
ncbi:MAG: phospholipase [Rhodospirillales bacterium RIFCSPLOWO2_12_FULL_58_28]|nr:MAG: phospholipase [Rhodospirillales bacterium RIFCSPLOWO2_02_FULL_58_16]OHC78035.1 MAG: phospholipase [Rhodospirillales bacterium RIFCSPLOWO2_12_FULL_58_28]